MPSQQPSEQNVVAIIQARMGSTRFPGKVLADLQGRPVLDWVVEAVKRVDGVDEIVVATTTNSEDQVIEEWCLSEGVNCFRGEPLDVLKRYADCAREHSATHVLIITADCPLIHPDTVSRVLRDGLRSGVDYFGLDGDFPDGFDCEGFSVEALERADRCATHLVDREHVTNFFKRSEGTFSRLAVIVHEGFAEVRLTVDYPEDLVFLRLVTEDAPVFADRWNISALVDSIANIPPDSRPNRFAIRNEGTPTER